MHSWIRLRPEDKRRPSVSATAAPMGKEPARWASHASPTHARQGSESGSHTKGMVPSYLARRTRSGVMVASSYSSWRCHQEYGGSCG